MLTIRKFKASEWRQYRDVRLKALVDSPEVFGSTYAESIQYPNLSWKTRIEHCQPELDHPLGAFIGAKVVGLAWGRIEPDNLARADLYQMWTSPEHRGQGIGRKLLFNIIEWAQDRKVDEIVLGVTIGNIPAQNLYRSAGFDHVGDPESLRADSDKLVQNMRRKL
jgi:ribosomal protein S18 acetylase RimI-like enzyme